MFEIAERDASRQQLSQALSLRRAGGDRAFRGRAGMVAKDGEYVRRSTSRPVGWSRHRNSSRGSNGVFAHATRECVREWGSEERYDHLNRGRFHRCSLVEAMAEGTSKLTQTKRRPE